MTTEVAPAAPVAEPAAAQDPAQTAQPPAGAPDQPFVARAPEPTPETTPPGTPETQAPPPPASQEPPKPEAKPLADLSDEELLADDRLKSLYARQSESERRRAQADADLREAQVRREYMASSQFVQDFEGLARSAASAVDDQGNVSLDREKVDGIFRNLLWTGSEQAIANIGQILGQDLPEGFAMTAEEQELLRAAQADFARDPIRYSGALVKRFAVVRDRAVLDAKVEAATREAETRIRREYQERESERQARDNREQSQQQPGPTATSGGPPASAWRSQLEIDTAHAQGRITTQAYYDLLDNGIYHRLPPR